MQDDQRRLIHLVSYGMFKGGSLSVNLTAQVDVSHVKSYTNVSLYFSHHILCGSRKRVLASLLVYTY